MLRRTLTVVLKLGLLVGAVAIVRALQRRDDARRRLVPAPPWPPLDVAGDQQASPATEDFSLSASAEEVGEAARATEEEATTLQRRLATAPTEVADRAEPELEPPAPAPSVTAAPSVAPEPAPGDTAETWVEPDGGACPPSHPVKAKLSSKVFHLPGMVYYERTNPDRCYSDAAAAEADGLRQAKR